MMKYSGVLLLYTLVLGLSSCETDDTEYWLSGIWVGQARARDVSFVPNENRTGSYRIEEGNPGTSDWYFEDERYWDTPSGTMTLNLGYNDRTCITNSWTDRVSLSDWYYDYYEGYLRDCDGISLALRRVGY